MCQFCLHTKMLSASSSLRKGKCMSQYIRTIHLGSTQVRVGFEDIFLYWNSCKSISFKKVFIAYMLIGSQCHSCLTHISERKFVETVYMFPVWEGAGRRERTQEEIPFLMWWIPGGTLVVSYYYSFYIHLTTL